MNAKIKGLLIAIFGAVIGYYMPILAPLLPSPPTVSTVAWNIVPHDPRIVRYQDVF